MIQNTPLEEIAGLARKRRCINVSLQATAWPQTSFVCGYLNINEQCDCNGIHLCSECLNILFKTDLILFNISASCQRLKGTEQELLKRDICHAIVMPIHSVKAFIRDPERGSSHGQHTLCIIFEFRLYLS